MVNKYRGRAHNYKSRIYIWSSEDGRLIKDEHFFDDISDYIEYYKEYKKNVNCKYERITCKIYNKRGELMESYDDRPSNDSPYC